MNNAIAEGILITSRLPVVPEDGKNVLATDGGARPNWISIDGLYERIASLENRLDAASIDAQCKDGTVTVTLNL